MGSNISLDDFLKALRLIYNFIICTDYKLQNGNPGG